MDDPPKRGDSPPSVGSGMSFLIDGFQLVGSLGSVGTYTRELVEGLIATGAAVSIALPREELNTIGEALKDSRPSLGWLVAPHPLRPDKTYRDLLIWNHRTLPELARTSSPDVHVSVYHHTPAWMPRGIRRATVIHDCCGLRVDCGYRFMGRAMMKHWSHLKAAATFADVIIPISEYTRQSFSKRFPSAAPKVVAPIYNAVSSLPIDQETVDLTLRRLGLSPNEFLLALAMPSKRKGTDVLIKGYQLYREQGGRLPLVFFGSGRISSAEAGADADTSGAIRVLGRIEDELRDSLFASATAFLFPSRCEGFGYPIVEAARRGCPVIAWQNTTAPEILPHEQWMPTLDAEHLATEIRSKESMSESQRDATRRRLQQQASRFTGSTLASSIMQLFKRPSSGHNS